MWCCCDLYKVRLNGLCVLSLVSMHSDSNTGQQVIMDNNFEMGDILRFTSAKLPPIHYAVYIGDGYIVHYNNTLRGKTINIFSKNKAQIMKETLKHYKKRLTYTLCTVINSLLILCSQVTSETIRYYQSYLRLTVG